MEIKAKKKKKEIKPTQILKEAILKVLEYSGKKHQSLGSLRNGHSYEE